MKLSHAASWTRTAIADMPAIPRIGSGDWLGRPAEIIQKPNESREK
jgi:hypothetical protein